MGRIRRASRRYQLRWIGRLAEAYTDVRLRIIACLNQYVPLTFSDPIAAHLPMRSKPVPICLSDRRRHHQSFGHAGSSFDLTSQPLQTQ